MNLKPNSLKLGTYQGQNSFTLGLATPFQNRGFQTSVTFPSHGKMCLTIWEVAISKLDLRKNEDAKIVGNSSEDSLKSSF